MPKTSFLIGLIFFIGLSACANQIPTQVEIPRTATPIPTPFPIRTPEVISIANSPLKNAIIASGDYLMRQQLPNGELAYQVNILNDDRAYASSEVRLMAGTGSLYTICRVSGNSKYCTSADLALNHYLENLISNPEQVQGTCFYANGVCPLGGATSTIDTIYKRWQATSDFTLEDKNLISIAIDLGYFIISMRRSEGGFYHSFDPHFAGMADADYFVTTFNGESLYALLQLYEMTENMFWLEQAREVNDFMITQPATEDYAHTYAFSMLARLDELHQEDAAYANEIANMIIAGQVRSLNPINSSIATATKIEALASIAQVFYLAEIEHSWLEREINTFITFVSARQIPDNNCGFEISYHIYEKYEGGIFNTCEDPSIRVDGVAHWINGVTAFLEYKSLLAEK
jgi:hypothetical protein